MKTDAQLQRDVIEELKRAPSVGRGEVDVAARGGVVTLSGQVDTYAQPSRVSSSGITRNRPPSVRCVVSPAFAGRRNRNVNYR